MDITCMPFPDAGVELPPLRQGRWWPPPGRAAAGWLPRRVPRAWIGA